MRLGTLIQLLFKPYLVYSLYKLYHVDTMGIVFVDSKTYRFAHANEAFQEALGYSESELRKTVFLDLVHPEDQKRTSDKAAEMVNDGTVTVRFENRYRKKDGSYVTLQWAAVETEGRYLCRVRIKK